MVVHVVLFGNCLNGMTAAESGASFNGDGMHINTSRIQYNKVL